MFVCISILKLENLYLIPLLLLSHLGDLIKSVAHIAGHVIKLSIYKKNHFYFGNFLLMPHILIFSHPQFKLVFTISNSLIKRHIHLASPELISRDVKVELVH
jgi:hypothetical protein